MTRSLGRIVLAAALVALPVGVMAQSNPGSHRSGTRAPHATGQQHNQPSASQNQSQMQTDNGQQPPQAKTLPPTSASQTAPNPQPQLSR